MAQFPAVAASKLDYHRLLLVALSIGAVARPAAAQVLSGKLAFVATQPCRIVDTRVGAPLGAGEAAVGPSASRSPHSPTPVGRADP